MNNSVVAVLSLLSLGSLLTFFLYYRLSFSERTVFKGRVRLLQFLWGVVLPPILVLPVFQLYRMLERNPLISFLPLSDDAFLFIIFSLIAFTSVGNGMHVAGVSIDYSAQNLGDLDEEEKAVRRVVAFFHHGFSHIMIHLPLILTTFVFFLFGLNHPEPNFLNENQVILLMVSSFIFGVILALGVVEGGSWKLMLPVFMSLFSLLVLVLKNSSFSIFSLPTAIFFAHSYFVSTIFLFVWGLSYRGFPEIIGELKVKKGHPVKKRRPLPALESHETAA